MGIIFLPKEVLLTSTGKFREFCLKKNQMGETFFIESCNTPLAWYFSLACACIRILNANHRTQISELRSQQYDGNTKIWHWQIKFITLWGRERTFPKFVSCCVNSTCACVLTSVLQVGFTSVEFQWNFSKLSLEVAQNL